MRSDEAHRRELLQRALGAAREGEAADMLAALRESGILDGLHRHIATKYDRFQVDDVDHIIGLAVDDFLAAAREGKRILRPGPWLFEVCRHHAYDFNEALGLTRHDRSVEVEDQPEADDEDDTRRARIRRAVVVARDLLPRIGEDQLQSVMAFVLEAIDAGELVGPDEVAEALHIMRDTAKRLINRGFERLHREATSLGVVFDARGLEAKAAEGHDDDT